VRLDRSAYLDAYWTADRQQTFLVNDASDWPLSVDWKVWPSYLLDSVRAQSPGEPIAAFIAERAILVDVDQLRYRGLTARGGSW
jgi:hypothetical protein